MKKFCRNIISLGLLLAVAFMFVGTASASLRCYDASEIEATGVQVAEAGSNMNNLVSEYQQYQEVEAGEGATEEPVNDYIDVIRTNSLPFDV